MKREMKQALAKKVKHKTKLEKSLRRLGKAIIHQIRLVRL